MIAVAALAVLIVTSVLLFAFGLNLLYLAASAVRLPRRAEAKAATTDATVCVQLPIYNERYVAERVLDAACEMEWPREHFEVQVLDDSDDDTATILASRVAHWRRRGIEVAHVRRGTRTGFKAGALAHGLVRTNAELIAVFDADFVPPRDFLSRTAAPFADPRIAFVQARWGHLDEGYSWFTRLQAQFIDFHFLVEQAVRSARGYFVNFTGSAGVWRKAAIVDSGGWTAETLTEDLDLSYRAQLRGWKAAYLEDLVVPEELPVSIDAYRSQQSRWATGSFQCAFRLLGPVWCSPYRTAVKVQATIHLLAYGVGPLMLLQLACYPTLLVAVGRHNIPWQLGDSLLLGVCVAASPWLGFIVAQTRRGRRWWSGLPSLLCQVVGAGMTLNVIFALVAAMRPGGTFVRTPKHRIVVRGQEWRDQEYVRVGDPRAALEALFGLGGLALIPLAVAMGQGLLAVYAGLFALGFVTVAALSFGDFWHVVRRRARHTALSGAATVAVVLGLASLLVLVASRLPEPFEDGYGHWLIAANLAMTGAMHDPLFSMEDTWLPGYQVVSAAVLHLFGVWQLGALKVMSAVFGAVTAGCVYALAPNRRQGQIAVVLLVLNPVFLFTSGSAVVEPFLTALLTGAALAAVRGRMRLAAVLAAAACATSTKAWIWVVAAAAFVLVEIVRSRSRVRALAWAVPAVSVLVFLQLGFAPASHSVARGSVEVISATARGSLPSGALGRLIELATTYGLAALPLAVFGAVGLVFAFRRHPTPLWRYLYVPAGVYLAAVFGLVAAGAYSGSHRYLYPALPAAALLAAAALDRYAVGVRLGSLAAATLLAVAFLPIFESFGDANAGLVAAGLAARSTPGAVLTDSPVVAYYSGKAPSQIFGSQSMPRDRLQAIAWLQEHGVTALVLEDISYYRATAVFPDLVRGSASAPFQDLANQAAFQVDAGKPVYAFRLPPALSMRMTAAGKTASLAKGMTLGPAGTGEGMGFGVPIARYADGWVYPRTETTVAVSPSSWTRSFELDEIGGDAAHSYRFAPIASRGEVDVTYVMGDGGVSVAVDVVRLDPGYSQIGILNEASAAFNDFTASDRPTTTATTLGGWTPVEGSWARLRSAALGVEWSVPALPGATLYAGREHNPPGFDWAGLDYMFPAPFAGASYRIQVQEAQ